MAIDHIRYDLLAQDALRGLVRRVLTDAAKSGLPGEHHFSITFRTDDEGVRMSPRLREQFPQEMTIILQHQFWDLKVNDTAFEAGLSFGGIPEKLTIPFTAIKSFFDPSVQFGLQFETIEAEPENANTPSEASDNADSKSAVVTAIPAPETEKTGKPDDDGGPSGDKPSGEVVRLDRFRKK
jgi:hypothetical protein